MALVNLDWSAIRQHYNARESVHRRLLLLHQGRLQSQFTDLALGITDPYGNHSASEHGIGAKVLATNTGAASRVFDLASKFMSVSDGLGVPRDQRCWALLPADRRRLRAVLHG
jgi:hypothetical protein